MSTSKKKIDKPFEKWSRKEKRNATVNYRGKTMRVLQYLAVVAAELNLRYRTVRKGTKEPVDHYTWMYKWYMAKGLDEVKIYLQRFEAESEKQRKEWAEWTEALNTLQNGEDKKEDSDGRHPRDNQHSGD